MNPAPFLNWIEQTWLGEFTRNSTWAFVTFETLHFIGLCILIGAMIIVDLRLLGVIKVGSLKSVLSFTHWAIFGFAINLLTGIGFFASAPYTYWHNPLFQIKMVLIIVAGLNVAWFELVERKKVLALVEGGTTGSDTKLVAGLSLVLWFTILVVGRFFPVLGAT